ncbi:hypothetical protein GW17_00046074 [Ensete ventricosum]|nr:hypothetical protein GW17_00046074 [Ensete ventricosum]
MECSALALGGESPRLLNSYLQRFRVGAKVVSFARGGGNCPPSPKARWAAGTSSLGHSPGLLWLTGHGHATCKGSRLHLGPYRGDRLLPGPPTRGGQVPAGASSHPRPAHRGNNTQVGRRLRARCPQEDRLWVEAPPIRAVALRSARQQGTTSSGVTLMELPLAGMTPTRKGGHLRAAAPA